MRRRAIAIVASLLLAGIGSFVLLNFVRGAEDRATAGEERKPAWIVTGNIPTGTAGEDIGVFVEQQLFPAKSIPDAAIGEDLTVLEGFVAQVDLVPGEVLLSTRFVTPDEVDTRREGLPSRPSAPDVEGFEELLQVPIRLDVEQALGGIIQPGDTVAILVTIDAELEGDSTVEVGGGDVIAIPDEAGAPTTDADAYTGIIIHKALVAEVQTEAVPTFTSGEGDDANGDVVLAPTTGFLVTFALTPENVERLVHAAQNGQIWLAAQGEDAADYATQPVNNEGIFFPQTEVPGQ